MNLDSPDLNQLRMSGKQAKSTTQKKDAKAVGNMLQAQLGGSSQSKQYGGLVGGQKSTRSQRQARKINNAGASGLPSVSDIELMRTINGD